MKQSKFDTEMKVRELFKSGIVKDIITSNKQELINL